MPTPSRARSRCCWFERGPDGVLVCYSVWHPYLLKSCVCSEISISCMQGHYPAYHSRIKTLEGTVFVFMRFVLPLPCIHKHLFRLDHQSSSTRRDIFTSFHSLVFSSRYPQNFLPLLSTDSDPMSDESMHNFWNCLMHDSTSFGSHIARSKTPM